MQSYAPILYSSGKLFTSKKKSAIGPMTTGTHATKDRKLSIIGDTSQLPPSQPMKHNNNNNNNNYNTTNGYNEKIKRERLTYLFSSFYSVSPNFEYNYTLCVFVNDNTIKTLL